MGGEYIPLGGWRAPKYDFADENHGFGHHIHVKVRNNGKYARSNLVLTKYNNSVVAYLHTKNAAKTFTLEQAQANKFVKNLKAEGLDNLIQKEVQWIRPPKNNSILYQVN